MSSLLGDYADRAELLAEAERLWLTYVHDSDRSRLDRVFSEWGSPYNERLWNLVTSQQVYQLAKAALESRDKGGSAADLQEDMTEVIDGVDRLRDLRDRLELLDTGRLSRWGVGLVEGSGAEQTTTPEPAPVAEKAESRAESEGSAEQEREPVTPAAEPQSPGSSETSELSRHMDRRRSEELPTSGLISRYAGTRKIFDAAVVSAPDELLEGVTPGSSGPEADRARQEALEGVRKVDRISRVLVDTVSDRLLSVARTAGITPLRRGSSDAQVSMRMVVEAALVMVLRAGGDPGIEVNEDLELLVELLSSGGDLDGRLKIDAQLELIDRRLADIESSSANAHSNTVELLKSSWLGNLLSSTLLAERLHIIKIPLGSLDGVDVVDQEVLSLVDRAAGAALGEWGRRRRRRGRPGAVRSDKRESDGTPGSGDYA